MNVEVLTLPEKRVATVSHGGPYNTISVAFGRLGQLTERAGLFDTSVAALLGIYYDDPKTTPAAELRSDAGLVIPNGVELPAELSEIRIPAGKYARTVHLGPYQGLADVWARFMGEWLPQSGRRMGKGATYEHYLNTPLDTKPEDLKTELYVPLAD